MKKILLLLYIGFFAGCSAAQQTKTTGKVERIDPSLDAIIDSNARPVIIAEGFEWSEGPIWIEKHQMLLFSDVPMNTIYKWTKKSGKEIYLEPSGYTGKEPSKSKEPGSNGLTLDIAGNLVLCQHGNRQMAKMDAPLDKPAPNFITLADQYNDKRFNSPNDAVSNSAGELFFTDPPYGLPLQNDKDPSKEQPFNGIYKLKKDGKVILLADSITRPNGIAFFPGEQQMIVANSDPNKPNWYTWDIKGDSLVNGRLFYSTLGYDKSWKGLPDGLKIDSKGNVFATGPGGIWILNSKGKLLGKIKLEEACSNVALSDDEKIIYITNDMYLLQLKIRK